jgi:SpoVK/Ycf46/Vps4 family AAA+-type ATPase
VETGQLVETDRSGLVSGYVGQTALKVMEVADRATGGVLLIDEAYALARGGENDFGREAIDTLVKVIEDRRDELVVIAAGYPDEMADFIGANPGLASRFPKTISFPDYTDDELWAIFTSIGEKAGYHPDDDAKAKVVTWLASVPRDKGFGNGRLARNLFEDAVTRHAARVVAIDDPTDDDLTTLIADDIAAPGEGPRHGNDG